MWSVIGFYISVSLFRYFLRCKNDGKSVSLTYNKKHKTSIKLKSHVVEIPLSTGHRLFTTPKTGARVIKMLSCL